MALEVVQEHGRLTPAMRSRKLQALDFIKRYFAQWGHSPTLGELAAHLHVSTKRSYDLVHQLAAERMLEVTAGKTRGIRLIDRAEELSEADVLLRLSLLGWTIGHEDRGVQPPLSEAYPLPPLTEKGLPALDFLGDEIAGKTEPAGINGRIERGRAGGRCRRAAGQGKSETGS